MKGEKKSVCLYTTSFCDSKKLRPNNPTDSSKVVHMIVHKIVGILLLLLLIIYYNYYYLLYRESHYTITILHKIDQ